MKTTNLKVTISVIVIILLLMNNSSFSQEKAKASGHWRLVSCQNKFVV